MCIHSFSASPLTRYDVTPGCSKEAPARAFSTGRTNEMSRIQFVLISGVCELNQLL